MKSATRTTVLNVTVTALFVALIAASAQIHFPLPSGVPVTLQTFAVAIAGYYLGVKRSLAALTTYIVMGLIGLPVFAGFTPGITALSGATGGFIIGFAFLVVAAALGGKIRIAWLRPLPGFVGILLCHLFGTGWFSILREMSFFAALPLVSFPFLIKDFVSVVVAVIVAARLPKLK